MCSRNQTCESEMQHSKYDGRVVFAIFKALKESTNKGDERMVFFDLFSEY